MTGRVAGKVALITGAAKEQGRSHAVRLAEEGADIIAVDACESVETVPYELGTPEELAETVALVERTGQRIVSAQVDVRDYDELKTAVGDGVAEFGRLDIVSAGAGVCSYGDLKTLEERAWQDLIDINLTGEWHAAKASIPHLRAAGGGSIIITSSIGGQVGIPGIGHYVAAKHGLVGLMKALALEVAADKIRVNTIHPTNVDTGMLLNDAAYARFAPDLPPEERVLDNILDRFTALQAMDIPWIETIDVSHAVTYRASDESRYVTGSTMTIDGGATAR